MARTVQNMDKAFHAKNGLRHMIAQRLLESALRISRSSSEIAGKIAWACYKATVQRLGLSHQIVRCKIYGHAMELPADSDLPSVLSRYPNYGRNLALIAAAVSAKYPGAPIIDVGANIGDTAVMLRDAADGPILCIEGSERYADLCRSNLHGAQGVTVVQALVDTGDLSIGRIVEAGGSGKAIRDESPGVRSLTLAEAAEEYGFSCARLVKIDTDGFDGRIIGAALPWIACALPVLFWEFELTGDAQNSGPGSRIFGMLAEVGYERFALYSNTGDYVLTLRSCQIQELQDVSWYFGQRPNRSHVPPHFADVCAFPAKDADIQESVRHRERLLNGAQSEIGAALT